MKKLSIIFSFALISVFSVGSYCLHKLYLQNYKKEFKAHIKMHTQTATAFSSITIYPSELYSNSSNIIWEDENKEVVCKGILYDVVSVKGKGLTVELTVVSDDQEMELKKQFAAMYDVGLGKQTKGPIDLLKHFLALKCIVHVANLDLNNFVADREISFSYPLIHIINRVIAQDTPPPDFSA